MAEARLVLTALALLLAMFLAAVHGLRHRVGISILTLLSLSWFTIDKLFEGDVVVTISRSQGVTSSDFVGALGLIVAAALWWRSGSIGRPGRPPTQQPPAPPPVERPRPSPRPPTP